MKDTSNELDYDVMSDQEWEEEPEGGESLSVPPACHTLGSTEEGAAGRKCQRERRIQSGGHGTQRGMGICPICRRRVCLRRDGAQLGSLSEEPGLFRVPVSGSHTFPMR